MASKRVAKGLCIAGFLVSSLLVGCATRSPYQGPISDYAVGVSVSQANKPIPVQLFVKAIGPDDPGTKEDLLRVFILNLKQSGKFADVSPAWAPVISTLARLDVDIDLKMEVSSDTSPLYVTSWGCIFPMFIPGNKITADGRMTAVVRDNQSVLKTYSAAKTKTAYRNSIGFIMIKLETRTLERWSRATLTALFDDLIAQIVNDAKTYQKTARVPAL
jgi:hypothetical protein